MADQIRIFGFAGSLRKASFNKALLQVALEVVPEDAEIETFDLEGIPPFNQDLEHDPPEKVRELQGQDPRRRRPPDRHAGVQLLHTGRF